MLFVLFCFFFFSDLNLGNVRVYHVHHFCASNGRIDLKLVEKFDPIKLFEYLLIGYDSFLFSMKYHQYIERS